MATTLNDTAPLGINIESIIKLYNDFDSLQENFQSAPVIKWHSNHAEIPILCISVYMVMVFSGPEYMKNRPAFKLKKLFAAWNLFLSIFSIMGAYYMVPVLLNRLYHHGFQSTVCDSPEWYFNGRSGFWLCLFIYSKFAELFDTAFLVLRKRNVIFLHWFHHLTVLLYCWHAYHHSIGCGVWFACMNYCVHSVMYLYYFMTNIGLYRVVAPFAQLITTVQILQMVGGMAVLLAVANTMLTQGPKSCAADSANWKLGLAMYFSYFILFALLFVKKYITGPKKSGNAAKNPQSPTNAKSGVECPPNMADVPCFGDDKELQNLDASGFFHSSKKINMAKKKVN